MFFHGSQMEPDHLPNGALRRIQVVGETMMTMEVTFPKAEEKMGGTHSHPHEQISYIARGDVLFVIGDEQEVMHAGDTVYVPGGVAHGTQALTDGAVVVDVFHPLREDLIAQIKK